MDIAGIWNSLRSVSPFDSKPAPGPAEATAPAKATSRASSLSPPLQEALQDILSRYDVTSITPRSFSQLLQELHSAGVLKDEEHEELAVLRLELDQQGVGPDERVDLLGMLRQKLKSQERDLEKLAEKGQPGTRPPDLDATLRQMDWMRKFALVHDSRNYQPLDTSA